jgi:hypothetical protein
MAFFIGLIDDFGVLALASLFPMIRCGSIWYRAEPNRPRGMAFWVLLAVDAMRGAHALPFLLVAIAGVASLLGLVTTEWSIRTFQKYPIYMSIAALIGLALVIKGDKWIGDLLKFESTAATKAEAKAAKKGKKR